MPFGVDVKGIAAKLDERFQQLYTILVEIREILAMIRDQRGPQ